MLYKTERFWKVKTNLLVLLPSGSLWQVLAVKRQAALRTNTNKMARNYSTGSLAMAVV